MIVTRATDFGFGFVTFVGDGDVAALVFECTDANAEGQ